MQEAGALPEHWIRKAGRFFLGRRISSEHRKIIVIFRRVFAAIEIKLSFDHCPLRAGLQNGVNRHGDPKSNSANESTQTICAGKRGARVGGRGAFAGRSTDTFAVTEFGYVASDIVSLLSQDGWEGKRLAGEKVCIAA